MQAILFNFSKRLNSTKRPNDAQGVPVSVSIKQNVPKGQSSSQSGTETFLSHPTIWVQGDYTEYNYMKFKGRYYFVRDVQLTINNATVIYGEIDVLATYKDEIRASSQFVLYDETVNTEIPDTRLSAKSSGVYNQSAKTLPFQVLQPSAIITVNAEGHMESFKVAQNLIPTLTSGFDDWAIANLTNERDLLRQLCSSGSIAENIKNAILIPFGATAAFESGDTRIELGSWQTSVNGKKVVDRVIHDRIEVSIPWTASDWRRMTPYTRLYVELPFVGLIEYPTDDIRNMDTLEISVALDVITGDMTYTVNASRFNSSSQRQEYLTIGKYGANCASSFMIGESNISGQQIVNGVMQGVSGLVEGEGRLMMGAANAAVGNVGVGITQIGAGFSCFGDAVNGIIAANTPINTVVGTLGGASAFEANSSTVVVMCVSHEIVGGRDGAIHFFGTPTMQYKSLANLTGYVQCQNASVDLAALEVFRDLVNNALNRGIYIE